MNRWRLLTVLAILTLFVGMGMAYADPVGVDNSASNPDTTGFNYYYVPQLQTENGLINYADPQLMFQIVLQNTLTEPNVLIDGSGNIFSTYNFADIGAVPTTINGVVHYVLTVNTTSNTTTQPVGVTESKSGVYHYGTVTLPDGTVIKFWVVDTQTAGDYNRVFVDIGADQIIDFSNLAQGSYFTFKDLSGAQYEIYINEINSTGADIKIYNAYDSLKAGDPSPIDGTPLKTVMKPHWVKVSIDTTPIANVKSVDFLLAGSNGTYRKVETTDFVLGNFASGKIDLTVLLGDYHYGSVYIPADRTIYALAHLEPATYNVTKSIDPNTNMTVLTIDIKNNAGIQLGAGYITIPNVAPSEAYQSIATTLKVVSGGATVDVKQGLDSVNLVIKLNSLPTTGTEVVLEYKYSNDLAKKIDEVNNKVNELYNVTQNDVVAVLNQLIQNSQNALQKLDALSNGTNIDLTPIQNQLDELNNNVQSNAQAISQLSNDVSGIKTQLDDINKLLMSISTNIQNIQSSLANMNSYDVPTMLKILNAEITQLQQNIQLLMTQIQNGAPMSAGANDVGNNSTGAGNGGNSGGATGTGGMDAYTQNVLNQLNTMLTQVNTIKATVSKFNDKTSPFIVMMYYDKLLLYENQYNNIVLAYDQYTLQNAISGKIDQLTGKLGVVINQMNTMQSSITSTVAKIPLSVQNTLNAKLTPMENQIAMAIKLLYGVLGLLIVVIALAYMGSKKKGGGEEEAPAMPGAPGAPMPGAPGQPFGGAEAGAFGGQPGAQPFGGEAGAFGGQQGGFGGLGGFPEQ